MDEVGGGLGMSAHSLYILTKRSSVPVPIRDNKTTMLVRSGV